MEKTHSGCFQMKNKSGRRKGAEKPSWIMGDPAANPKRTEPAMVEWWLVMTATEPAMVEWWLVMTTSNDG